MLKKKGKLNMDFNILDKKLLKNNKFNKSDVVIDTGKETVVVDRKDYIGGSDIPVIMGIDKRFETAYGLARKKAGLDDFTYSSSVFAEYGDLFEPKIREYVNNLYNANFTPACLLASNFRANTDGYDENLNGILEIKTNNGKDDQFKKYEVQMLFYMICYKKDYGILAEYSRGDDLKGIMFDNTTKSGFRENLPPDFKKPFCEERIKLTFVPYNVEKAYNIMKAVWEFLEKVKYVKRGIIENESEWDNFSLNKNFNF